MPYPNEYHFEDQYIFRELARSHGITVIGLAFKNMETQQVNYEDPKQSYYFPESGSGESVLRAVDELKLKYHIRSKKFGIYGISGGASAAYLFSKKYPERVKCLSMLSGRQLDDLSILSIPTWNCVTYSDSNTVFRGNEIFFKSQFGKGGVFIQSIGMPTWERRGQPFFAHGPNRKAENLAINFLSSYISDAVDKSSTDNKAYRISIANPFLGTFSSSEEVPVNFPSEEFYRQWKNLSPRSGSVAIGSVDYFIAKGNIEIKARAFLLNGAGSDFVENKRDCLCLAETGRFAAVKSSASEYWKISEVLDVTKAANIVGSLPLVVICRNVNQSHIENLIDLHPNLIINFDYSRKVTSPLAINENPVRYIRVRDSGPVVPGDEELLNEISLGGDPKEAIERREQQAFLKILDRLGM